MAGRSYDTVDVPTVGGDIHVGRWPGGPHVVVAVHGVTFLHTEYHAFADQVGEDFTVLAPDLRGRGGSARLGFPFGLPAHADDVAAVLRHLGVRRSTVLGHSWGAAVALVTARRHPSLVDNLVLVDGGLPAEADPDAPKVAHNPPAAVVERLGTRYPTAEAYLEVWRAHPGLRRHWNPYLETHFRYELTGEEGQLHSSLREDAFLADVAATSTETTRPGRSGSCRARRRWCGPAEGCSTRSHRCSVERKQPGGRSPHLCYGTSSCPTPTITRSCSANTAPVPWPT